MKIHRSVIAEATDEQLLALRDRVLKGRWEHIDDEDITVYLEWGTVMVILRNSQHDSAFVIGIEKDGYTHS